MTHTYPISIPEAAKLLDTVEPKWAAKVDINSLCMSSQSRCILGCIFGNYDDAIYRLFNKRWSIDVANDTIFGSKASIESWKHEITTRTNLHDFKWAVEQLKLEKKVRRKIWMHHFFIYLSASAIYNYLEKPFSYNIHDFDAADWELYDKVKLSDIPVGKQFRYNETVYTKMTNANNRSDSGCYGVRDSRVTQFFDMSDTRYCPCTR